MNGLDTSKKIIPEEHDLHKLDVYLGLEKGTTYKTINCHGDPALLNTKLIQFEIHLKPFGDVPQEERTKWKELMIAAGINQFWWKEIPELQYTPIPKLCDQH